MGQAWDWGYSDIQFWVKTEFGLCLGIQGLGQSLRLVEVWVVARADIWNQGLGQELDSKLRYKLELDKDKAELRVRFG